ncbi:MAG: deoxyribodipyrimidine photo-lyase [Pseudomonadota bacterium]
MASSNASPLIVWFRNDLRIDDNPALLAAADTGRPLLPLYIREDADTRRLGGALKWWLHRSLTALAHDLRERGLKLHLLGGDAADTLAHVARSTGASGVHWNRRYSGDGIQRDTAVKTRLKAQGLEVESFNSHLLYEPWTLKTGSGGPYRVFTPFSRAARASGMPDKPKPAPRMMHGYEGPLDDLSLEAFDLLPTKPDWSGGLQKAWKPGTDGAQQKLDRFLAEALENYPDKRDRPGIIGTSRLSPYLRFGELSPRAIWHAAEVSSASRDAVFKFHQELLWREFSYHLLYHYPDLCEANHQPKFDAFPWRNHEGEEGAKLLRAWQKGSTGYPIVDAGMRELWHTGWMHNRVRMIVGSFLVKHLLIDWRQGEEWFWDTLVDADPANNAASWQWVAGSGADAAPYFRIFNPVLQGEKFDGDGSYTRQWVPEVTKLPKKFLHKPWEAPTSALSEAGITLGETYPRPIVDHREARERALDAFKSLSDAANAA